MAFAVALAGCTSPPVADVLLVTFDTTRYDRFGATGDPEARTPTVDALAARGLAFDHAYASVALTLPSHTTIMTGIEPLAHGVHNNGRFRVPEGVATLAERLRAAGFDTAAFVSAFVLDRRYGLDRGFAQYDDRTRKPASPLDLTVPQRPGAEVTDAALAWVAARPPDRPFFCWAHYYDPHLPRTVGPPPEDMPDRYAAEIAYADAQLGRLLAGVARARPLLVVFTADHGEGFRQHGEETHGILAYDSTLHVPLVVAGPGVPAGVRSDVLARHVDVVPTVLARVGLPAPPGLTGRDLVAAAQADADDPEVVGWFESRGPHFDLGWAPIEGIRTARWKYTATPAPPELYDLRADPGETTNRAEAEPTVRADLEARRAALERRVGRAEPARRDAVDVEEMERLAALGYVELPVRPPSDPPDPRRFAEVRDWVDGARELAASGRYDQAIEALEALAQSAAVRPLVLRTLAPIYAERGRVADAVATYREYIAATGAEEAHLGLVRALLGAGRPAEALAALDAVPGPSGEADLLRAHALARLGRHGEARAAVDRALGGVSEQGRRRKRAALVIDAAPVADGEAELRALLAGAPDDALVRSRLGYYLAVWGHPVQADEAMRLLLAAARAEPEDLDIQANLGWGAAKLGRDLEAAAALEAVVAREPARALERFRLAVVLERRGDAVRARALARSALALRPAADWSDAARALVARLDAPAPGRTP